LLSLCPSPQQWRSFQAGWTNRIPEARPFVTRPLHTSSPFDYRIVLNRPIHYEIMRTWIIFVPCAMTCTYLRKAFCLNLYPSDRWFVNLYQFLKYWLYILPPPPDGATARGGPWPPLQYASKSLGSLLYVSIRLYPSFSGPWTRHPAISFLVFLFVLLHTAFRTAPFLGLRCLAFFLYVQVILFLAFNKPDNVLSFDYGF